MASEADERDDVRVRIDTSVAQPARRYNYWLGGKDNFAADRASGDEIAAAFPTVRVTAVENRRFLRRAVEFLAGEAGIRQFLDIGTGLPTADNTHEVAQRIAPDSRVVYVDNDPMVMAHARALLTSTPQGRTAYIEADLRDPASILSQQVLRDTIDLSKPVALMLVAVLHFVPGPGAATPLVRELLSALAPGSYVAATNTTYDLVSPEIVEAYERLVRSGRTDIHSRPKSEFLTFFEGTELVEPGVVPVSEWRAENEPQPRPTASDVAMWAAVGRLP